MPNWFEKLVKKELQHRRYNVGTKTSYRLNQSLRMMGRSDLIDKTLLTKSVAKKHAHLLERKIKAQFRKITGKRKNQLKRFDQLKVRQFGYFKVDEQKIADETVRFLTIVHQVQLLSVKKALESAKELRQYVRKYIREIDGIKCIGVIEVEVVSMKHNRRVNELNMAIAESARPKEHRKLDVLETLSKHLSDTDTSGEVGQLLIHFHGVVFANDTKQFDLLESAMKTESQWSIAPRQIQFSKLSKLYRDTPKAVNDNFRDIAAYLTKGGADMQSGKPYLKYKVSFNNNMKLNYEEFFSLNWRSTDELAKAEIAEEGYITDITSLSPIEISVLAEVNDSMMSWNKTRTGYCFTAGKL
jgi:hypothetical protein